MMKTKGKILQTRLQAKSRSSTLIEEKASVLEHKDKTRISDEREGKR